MMRSEFALPATSNRRHGHQRLKAFWVHGGSCRLKTDIHAFVSAERAVFLYRTGIGRQILGGSELGRVHKDADNQRVTLSPRRTDQCSMPGVQRTHRRNQADHDPFALQPFAPGCHRQGRADRFHESMRGLQVGREPYFVEGWGNRRRISDVSVVSASIWFTERRRVGCTNKGASSLKGIRTKRRKCSRG